MINFHLWSGSTAIQMVTTVEPTCATTYRQSPVKALKLEPLVNDHLLLATKTNFGA